ncbi:MAG: radical SAM protein [Nitrospirae bacterium]|nr:radical SAM protein [Nitrospirota bacterium]
MKVRTLLINPWIYDFAAYNLWAQPVGLFKVAEYLGTFETELFCIDCTDSSGAGKYGTGKFRAETAGKPGLLGRIPRTYKRYGISTDEFVRRARSALPVDIVLVTSMMSYWYPGVLRVIALVRDLAGDVPVMLGGIYATLYHEHASRASGADFIYRGPLRQSFHFALSTFGFGLRKKAGPTKSWGPGLCGEYPFAVLLTSTGCPFRCSYCASKLLAENYERRAPEDVLEEVKRLRRRGVCDYVFYDDALLAGAEDHIKPLLAGIVREGISARFHAPNGLHARYIDRELAGLMRNSGFKTIRLGLETTDPERQTATGAKVSCADLERAVGFLQGKGFTKKEIGAYLMYGLPGQRIEEVREGLSFLKGLGARIHLTEFSLIKGTQSWKELVVRGVIGEDLDPLLTNNTVFTYLYSGYDPRDIEGIKLEVKNYNSE